MGVQRRADISIWWMGGRRESQFSLVQGVQRGGDFPFGAGPGGARPGRDATAIRCTAGTRARCLSPARDVPGRARSTKSAGCHRHVPEGGPRGSGKTPRQGARGSTTHTLYPSILGYARIFSIITQDADVFCNAHTNVCGIYSCVSHSSITELLECTPQNAPHARTWNSRGRERNEHADIGGNRQSAQPARLECTTRSDIS